jgi:hypothetical protein
MRDSDKPPTVFISYSHDSPDHKRWVLDFASELLNDGVDVILDAWDLRLGDDIPKFMERLKEADRVLMICTEKYVAKANDGVGGVGYEAMIVTAEIVRDLGTAKFIPIIRQNTDKVTVPTSVSTRLHVNLSEGADRESQMKGLMRDLHDIPPGKPALGRSPFPVSPAAHSEVQPIPFQSEVSRDTTEPVPQDPKAFFEAALKIAERGNMLEWRRIVARARRLISPALKVWSQKYGTASPGDIDTLIEQSIEGTTAFAQLTAVALAGVVSTNPKFGNQLGMLEDIMNPSEWQRGGLVVRVELPETAAFACQALLGATCLHIGNVRAAIELARYSTVDRKTGNQVPLWQRHDVIGWPQSLGRNATKTWDVALSLSARWQWLDVIFNEESEYQAALYAYYVTMSFIEFVERVCANFQIPDDPVSAGWWPDVPVFFEITDNEIKRQGYRLVVAEKSAMRAWLLENKVDENALLTQWPKWMAIQLKIFSQERPFFGLSRQGLTFRNLIHDLLER